ncbi:MAG: Tripartite tricarboxylate transporter TctB family [uncultured Propionibacteriaceae bacterium]|uniref:Tripartite tricarboxylate transporter TctB family n=1 Tax=uncultured Propionibacteriaceae bacterium TaxID=257457 RepID=A0A6J4NCW2_9ACTN|nr:MAG: Tripartite tricarboxylate transporter TctB family [uncultured Propionibacteriaceae bacterium]
MSSALAAAGESRRPLAEFIPSAFLALLGIILLVDAGTLSNNRTGVDPLGPRPAPILVGAISLVLAIALAVAVYRGDRAEAESGEDVDLSSSMDLKTVLLLIGVFLANIVLIDLLGWVISGGLLFYGSALALGSRHLIRDLCIAAALSLSTFYGFAIGLGVNLPAGILQGIL